MASLSFRRPGFQDETFFTYRERAVAVAEEFLRRLGAGNGTTTNRSFTWTATMRADQGERLGDEVMALCVRSGLRRVMIGVESGSQEMMAGCRRMSPSNRC